MSPRNPWSPQTKGPTRKKTWATKSRGVSLGGINHSGEEAKSFLGQGKRGWLGVYLTVGGGQVSEWLVKFRKERGNTAGFHCAQSPARLKGTMPRTVQWHRGWPAGTAAVSSNVLTGIRLVELPIWTCPWTDWLLVYFLQTLMPELVCNFLYLVGIESMGCVNLTLCQKGFLIFISIKLGHPGRQTLAAFCWAFSNPRITALRLEILFHSFTMDVPLETCWMLKAL